MHLVVRFLGYLGYLLLNLDIIYIKRKLNISAIEGYIVVGKGVQNICSKEYDNSYLFLSYI